MRYVSTVSYSGPPDENLDLLIGGVAKINGGKPTGSGYDHACGERHMGFSFGKKESAEAFGREVLSTKRGIMRTRVDRVDSIPVGGKAQ
jgi:hypothetical protein